jgi:hypothetical protein
MKAETSEESKINDPHPLGRGIYPSGRYLITPQAAGNVPEGIQAAPEVEPGRAGHRELQQHRA